MYTAILVTNDGLNLLVIDIPHSLEFANGGGRIYSSKAPTIPYVTPEPKGRKREAVLSALPAHHIAYNEDIQKGVRNALQDIFRLGLASEWCFARTPNEEEEPALCLPSDGDIDRQNILPLILSAMQNDLPSQKELSHDIVLNPSKAATHIHISGCGVILIPAMCAFLWGNIERALIVLEEYPTATDLLFDCILMDPPWANRSVRNGYKYSTTESQSLDLFDDAIEVVKRYRKPTGYVAVWITNKAAIRQKVLKSMGRLSLYSVEEWVWVKVTCHGEPVTPLDGVWRHPYEVLLVFSPKNSSQPPLRRYIFAVPDVHSRKPNLKEIFDKLFHFASVLELFARNLTSGWWSVGNEVLKFQHQNAWSVWPDPVPSSTHAKRP